jgi:hypothetical protein
MVFLGVLNELVWMGGRFEEIFIDAEICVVVKQSVNQLNGANKLFWAVTPLGVISSGWLHSSWRHLTACAIVLHVRLFYLCLCKI